MPLDYSPVSIPLVLDMLFHPKEGTRGLGHAFQ